MDTNSSKKIKTLKTKLMQCVIKLGKLNVPAHFVYFEKKQVSHFGTLKAMNKFEATNDCKCNCNCVASNSMTWKEAFKEDGINLANGAESVFDNEKITELGISNYFTTLQKPKKLSAPLSVARYVEITDYLKYLILLEHAERGRKGNTIVFGDENWRPRDCWVEHDWSWSQIHTNFKNLKSSDYPGPGRLIDFFRRCVKKGLDARGIDPETYYSEEFSNKELEKRRRRRGISNVYNGEQTEQCDDDDDEKKRIKDGYVEKKAVVTENLEDYYTSPEIQSDKGNYDFLTINGSNLGYQGTFIEDNIQDYHRRFNEKNKNVIDTERNEESFKKYSLDNSVDLESIFTPNQQYTHPKKDVHANGTFPQKHDFNGFSDDEITEMRFKRKMNIVVAEQYDEEIPEKKRRNYYKNSDYQRENNGNTDLNKDISTYGAPIEDNIEDKKVRDNEIVDYREENSTNNDSRLGDNQVPKPTERIKNQENVNARSNEIINFFSSISLPDLADLFISEDVTMEVLSEMSAEDLKEIGVSKFGQRFIILKYVKNTPSLSQKCTTN